ncbi:MAG: TetR/AcrR family transcriptional regulator [Pseudomonadota bacterium]|nr:TetR/AcrR family transcriptional regulator [Pseudomonadota bacterium]
MRITKQRAAENRERVVAEAARLFREKGFDGVGVAELMAAAGLTHGGFYNHFGSKAQVEAAACAHVFDKSVARIARVATAPEAERPSAYADYRERYVSPEARDASAAACPMVAFAGDVSRQSEAVRDAYAQGLAAYLQEFVRASGGSRPQAIRAFAELVGALTLARSVAQSDPALSDEILAAARGTA